MESSIVQILANHPEGLTVKKIGALIRKSNPSIQSVGLATNLNRILYGTLSKTGQVVIDGKDGEAPIWKLVKQQPSSSSSSSSSGKKMFFLCDIDSCPPEDELEQYADFNIIYFTTDVDPEQSWIYKTVFCEDVAVAVSAYYTYLTMKGYKVEIGDDILNPTDLEVSL